MVWFAGTSGGVERLEECKSSWQDVVKFLMYILEEIDL